MNTLKKDRFVSPRNGFATLLACITMFFVAGCAAEQSAVVVQYHHISSDTPRATSISPALFKEHIQHLDEAGYQVIPLPDIVSALQSGESLPDKAVAITFDDGYRSVYDTAFPVLKRKGWPFTVFVNTRPVNREITSQFVSWEELREMAAAGATIANHSYSHPHFLRRLDGESKGQWRERIEQEIERARQDIEQQTGQSHRLFAYPYGEYNKDVQAILERKDFIAFGQQSGPVGSNSDWLALPRFPFGGPYGDIDEFKTKVASLPMPIAESRVSDDDGDIIEDTVLPQSVDRPKLQLNLAQDAIANRVQCFASGQGAIDVQVEGNTVMTRASRALRVGRSRYNCTAQSEQAGRFYWYSEFFIRKKPDGSWYEE